VIVVAIDPGREKCGVAICAEPAESETSIRVLHKEIVATERVVARLLQLKNSHAFERVLLGDGTHSSVLARAIRESFLEVELVPEAFTSQRARERLRATSLPRGLWKLIPQGMRPAPHSYDDHVAVILAEDWFGRRLDGIVSDVSGG
jgi:RNase H-fold protein (predicted Holliday junction resolvase)